METTEWKEDFKLLLPKPDHTANMLEVTGRVLENCVALAEEYDMDAERVHMWKSADHYFDEHYEKFRIVVEFPECTMWLDACVYDDAGTNRRAVSTYATVRDENNKTIWHNYMFNEPCLRSVFERYTQ